MRALPASPIFTRVDALAAGWSDAALLHAVATGQLVRLRRGIYADPRLADPQRAEAIAASIACSGSVISHASAAVMHGIPLLVPAGRPELTVTPTATGDTTRALVHRARIWPPDMVEVDGHPVTSVARTVADLARDSSVTAGVVALDHCLRHSLVTRAGVEIVARRCRGWPFSRRIGAMVELADERSESPLESYSRVKLRANDVPEPDLQTSICALDGRFLGRVDFYWEHAGVVGEADGRTKYVSADVLIAEKERQERLEQTGLVVVRWGWEQLREPRDLLRRLKDAFERGRQRDRVQPRRWIEVASAPRALPRQGGL